MRDHPRISDVRLTPADDHHRRSGLLGFVQFVLDDELAVDGVTLRLTADGRHALSYPCRRGDRFPYLRPVDNEARQRVEAAVFDALGIKEGGGR